MRVPILLAVLLGACLSGNAQRNKEVKPHEEDLSAIRPKFTAESSTVTANNSSTEVPVVKPVLTVNDHVNTVLDSIDQLNVLRKFVSGYAIQIYSGQSREDANNSKKKLLDDLDMRADLRYQQPKFRVMVGNYFTTLEAQRDLVLLRRFFPNAILVPESVPIK